PVDCLRIYDFHLGGFEKLHVIADNREKSFEKKLEIVYLPDKRYGPPQKIIELKKHQDKGLFSDDLEKKICTDNFKYR
ncbi:hypothetical protein KY312_04665, partial [Candidatus Woesearchaeota archaeon]|nr:hypothetical protein [Candidatus Woesearchaeota archaeon]